MADDNVTPIGARLGSQKLYADARAADDEHDRVHELNTPPPPPAPAPVVALTPPPPPPRDRHRQLEAAATALELCGGAALVAGFWLLSMWAGLIAAGVALVLVGAALSPSYSAPTRRRRKGETR